MEDRRYNPSIIEPKWQKIWEEKGTYSTPNNFDVQNKKYILDMFPYPSGAGLHVGHCEGNTATDIYCRYLRMNGYSVLHPMGWDAFGLPAENYAIKTGVHPAKSTQSNINNFRRQLIRLGFSYDWEREIDTSNPDYYKWTQWLFLQLYKKGLAYRKKAPVNWCPGCNTVLANEQVVNGKCERSGDIVVQKELAQWFFKITDYAQELLDDIDKLDWPEPIKLMQKNWIGKSEGTLINFKIQSSNFKIDIFTTRPDTLFGATYVVLAPEHQLIRQLADKIKNWDEVEDYIQMTKKKTNLERTDLAKEKTGVELKGITAINPANNEEIPIWIADYVLASYGTGAIMAVPAHDERDFEFAQKFKLPIKQVIAPLFSVNEGPDAFRKDKPTIRRKTAYVFLKDPKKNRYVCLDWKKLGWHSGIIGGVEENEDYITAAKREIREETGYINTKFVRYASGEVHNQFFAGHKDENRYAYGKGMLFELVDEQKEDINPEDLTNHNPIWIAEKEMQNWLNLSNFKYMWQSIVNKNECYSGDGIMIDSGEFTGISSEKAKWEITNLVSGKNKIEYRLRDWLISRQRYWGAPIPIIYCEKCGAVAVPEDQLPVELPTDVDFKPTGESPLALSKTFHNATCPKCQSPAKRESDTLDTFVDSSWYFLRFTDPNNSQEFASSAAIKQWLPVDTYVGGAEHAVLHLLYARFFTKALRDMGYLEFNEPFSKLINQGLILAEDGRKMSKSLGNVVNPDEIVDKFGADTFRMYEMFMGPLEDAKPWSTRSMIGIYRFLEKVWRASFNIKFVQVIDEPSTFRLEQLKEKITHDIQEFSFNTAIAEFMKFNNDISSLHLTQTQWQEFLILLSPFAPHIAEELWSQLKKDELISVQSWPKIDSSLAKKQIKEYIIIHGNKKIGFINSSYDIEKYSQPQILDLLNTNHNIKTFLKENIIKTVKVTSNSIIIMVE